MRSGPFRWHLLAYVLLQAITIGFGYMIPNSCQLGYGVAPLIAGVLVLPGALVGAAAAPVAGSLLDRYGAARPIIVAMSVAVLGVALMVVLVGPDSNVIVIGTCYFIYMLGFSMCFANTMTSGMGYIAPQFKSDGNAVFSTFQQLAGAVGTTVMSVFLGMAQAGTKSGTAEFAKATISGTHWGYVALLIVAVLALLSNLHALMLGRRITVH
ncbi:MFS transporter [Bifidobacterium callimiconis]|uniref:MFS transporter n=1 Tax=Bifidobacterium callimiconis TaxID=2306973 RepID=UPI001F0B6028|nr:MFS transporter [Bifidobacterium callimiconis]